MIELNRVFHIKVQVFPCIRGLALNEVSLYNTIQYNTLLYEVPKTTYGQMKRGWGPLKRFLYFGVSGVLYSARQDMIVSELVPWGLHGPDEGSTTGTVAVCE